jgi:xanthine dehydrogenase molybdopterin-binding subunit B
MPIFCLSQVQLPLSQRGYGTKDQQGCVIINAEELVAMKDEVVMQFRGTNLDKMNFFGKADPFLVFYKSLESGEYVVVHKTEVNIAVVATELD